MKKFIKLLNEYRTEKGERNLNEFEVSQTLDSLNYLRLFIKRLVDNDKINFNKVDRIWSWDFLYPMDTLRWNVTCEREYFEEYNEYDRLLMLLAISDTPIQDLISYLK